MNTSVKILVAAALIAGGASPALAADCMDKNQHAQAETSKDGSAAPLDKPKDAAGVTETAQGTTQNFDKAKAETEGKQQTTGSTQTASSQKAKPCP